MTIQQRIDSLIPDIYPLLPSWGTCPFTVIRTTGKVLKGAATKPSLEPVSYLLVLSRTDFSVNDLLDYVKNSREYNSIDLDKRETFLEAYLGKAEDKAPLAQWRERITSMGLGVMIHLARNNGLSLTRVATSFISPEDLKMYRSNNLEPYQLFRVGDTR